MAAVGRRPCGFQGPRACLLPAGGVLPASPVAICPSLPPQAARFLFIEGKEGAPGADQNLEKEEVCVQGRGEVWNEKGDISGPFPSHPGPTSSTAANQTVGIHWQNASPADGRPSPLKGLGKRGQGRRGPGKPSSALLPAPLCHLRPLLTSALQRDLLWDLALEEEGVGYRLRRFPCPASASQW